MGVSLTDLTRDDASSIAGWISIACWVIVYSPQIWENYQLKSGEGLSVAFVVLWLIGDLTNLAGGAMAHLLPTMIILAVYYTACDVVLLFQIYYYRAQRRRAALDPERQPLTNSPHITHNHNHTHNHTHATAPVPPAAAAAEPTPFLPAWIRYPLLLLFVCSVGFGAWYAQSFTSSPNGGGGGPIHPPHPHTRHGHGHGHKGHRGGVPPLPPVVGKVPLEWKSQVLGYSSMALYIGSRVPQIAHNAKTRCAGLSLSLFFFSISGNITYVASILLKSVERSYVIANISWLIGSGGTVFLDLIVLGQFVYYRSIANKAGREEYMDDSDSSDD